jgi:hypothetical protein
MEIKIEFYPSTGYVVEIITPVGTYQLCGERDIYKATCNKETLEEILKNPNTLSDERLVDKCPICGEEMNGIVLAHYKCNKCNNYFTN